MSRVLKQDLSLMEAAAALVLLGSVSLAAAGEENLKILDTRFEPLREGKNVLYVEIENTTSTDQTFAVHVQTKSTQWGWGRPYFASLRGHQKERIRIPYKIHTPLTDAAWIRVQYYNPTSVEGFEFDKWFKQTKYLAGELPHRPKAAASQPVGRAEKEAVTAAFRRWQGLLREKAYTKVWESFTDDLKQAEFFEGCKNTDSFQEFAKAMDLPSRSWWTRAELIALRAGPVTRLDLGVVLNATCQDRTVPVHLVQVEGVWKIDWIGGFAHTRDWKERLLPLMNKRSTDHFDVHFFQGSTAGQEIERIIEQREGAFQRVRQFVEKNVDVRICLILFEDGPSKQHVTGHQGDGWAFDRTVVEVYNPKRRLDPSHETTHIVMGAMGHPPALFNEGFAVYMEAGHKWEDESVDVTAARLAEGNRLTPLSELITRTEIGARKDDGQIAYPESASFVKFLIDTYGKQDFLRAYAALQNSDKPSSHRRNLEKLERIYGKPLTELEQNWRGRLLKHESRPGLQSRGS